MHGHCRCPSTMSDISWGCGDFASKMRKKNWVGLGNESSDVFARAVTESSEVKSDAMRK